MIASDVLTCKNKQLFKAMAPVLALVIFLSSLFLLRVLLRFVVKAWWTPIHIQKTMKSQGIEGLPYAFPHGNTRVITAMRTRSMNQPMELTHGIFSRIQPHVHSWIKIYGKIYGIKIRFGL